MPLGWGFVGLPEPYENRNILDGRNNSCYGSRMNLPPEIQARRVIEDRAAVLGAEREQLDEQSTANTAAIMALLGEAEDAGMPIEHFAALVKVTKQTLYRWKTNRKGSE
jgi:hypothetical protein